MTADQIMARAQAIDDQNRSMAGLVAAIAISIGTASIAILFLFSASIF